MKIKSLPLIALALFASSAVFVHAGDDSAKAKSDAAFAKKAAMSNLTEVELGRVAEEKAESSDVKSFAKMMVADHSNANVELVKIAKSEKIELPTEVDAKNQAMVDKLAEKSGAEFDKEYVGHMVKHHEKSVKMYRAVSEDASNPQIQEFAKETLPALEKHLEEAKELQTKLS